MVFESFNVVIEKLWEYEYLVILLFGWIINIWELIC